MEPMTEILPDLPALAPAPAEWTWLLANEAGVTVPGPIMSFASQDAAEEWLTDHFPELVEQGVDAVTLCDADHAIYGPMSLHAQ